MKKQESYTALVQKRKSCRLCCGLTNPADDVGGQFDSNEIGPWSIWQGNLDAKVLIVGQDWRGIPYFRKWQGRDQPAGNPTNENLQALLKRIGYKVGKPRETQERVLFFTNLILCLKPGSLQAPLARQNLRNCACEFFQSLVEIIEPKAVLSLGKDVSQIIMDLYRVEYPKGATLSAWVSQSPYILQNHTVLFPLYHCGRRGVNMNRPLALQTQDWDEINEWLKEHARD